MCGLSLQMRISRILRLKCLAALGTVRGQGAPLPPAGLHGGGVQEPRRSRQPDEGQVGRRFKYTVPTY